MTKEELLKELKEIAKNKGSCEEGHLKADALLIEYIDDGQIAKAYNKIHKWYA